MVSKDTVLVLGATGGIGGEVSRQLRVGLRQLRRSSGPPQSVQNDENISP